MIKKKYTVETWEVFNRKYVVTARTEEEACHIVANNTLKHDSEIVIDFDIVEIEEHDKDEWKLDV